MRERTGAAVLLEAAARCGVKLCIANPGTTELGLVHALDDAPSIRPVLGLFEGVCTGAADGYARVTGKPALTLLHLGPGFANGIANLHNARRARSPVINIIGDHASWHLAADSPLTSDIAGLAAAVSDVVIRLERGTAMVDQVVNAIELAQGPPGKVVSLIASSDFMDEIVAMNDAPVIQASVEKQSAVLDSREIETTAQALLKAPAPIVLLGGAALRERGLRAAARIADVCGARLLMECYPAYAEMGGDLPCLERLAYFPQDVLAQLGQAKILLADAKKPVSYFGYAGQPSILTPPEQLIPFRVDSANVVQALERLADCFTNHRRRPRIAPRTAIAVPASDTLTPIDVAEVLCEHLPEGAIVSLEGSTCGGPFLERAHRAKRHAVMTNTGGAIGQGLPCAVGAALAQPHAKVICLQSDGSAQYTVQALWTMAKENLNAVVLISANHRYGILQTELKRALVDISSPATSRLTRIDSPSVDWEALARAYGVPSVKVSSRCALTRELDQALHIDGPRLIEMTLP